MITPILETSKALLDYYDSHLRKHGDTAQGAAWPDEAGRQVRFQAGLDIICQHLGKQPLTLCDLGCGTGELYRYIQQNGLRHISYVGVDCSVSAIASAKEKFPEVPFYCIDTLTCGEEELSVFNCDFVFANGLFTVKHQATHADMWNFMTRMIETVWPRVRRGVIFNVMSKIVDWERDDLFHVSFDDLARFLTGLAGQATGYRSDYGLYEIMAYALKTRHALERNMTSLAQERVEASAQINPVIPVCRPLLPESSRLLPYLTVIDSTRRYSNYGELVAQLTCRLAKAIGTTNNSICLASSGTAGLVGAILASTGRAGAERPLAFCSAYTFVASALAIELAGFQPYLVDVSLQSWSLEPDMIYNHPEIDRVGLILVTAPYGQPVKQSEWARLSRETRIPVIIDAAASFENVCANPEEMVGGIPIVLSLHATKAFSSAEGGIVISSDPDFQQRIYGALNFGFVRDRSCSMPSTNGKMSEYHAAIGLAELDHWDAKLAGFRQVASIYRDLAVAAGISGQIVTAPRIGSNYVLFVGRNAAETAAVERALQAANVDYRRWYGQGLHREPHFRSAPSDTLQNTSLLAECTLGLPMAPDMPREHIEKVMWAISSNFSKAFDARMDFA